MKKHLNRKHSSIVNSKSSDETSRINSTISESSQTEAVPLSHPQCMIFVRQFYVSSLIVIEVSLAIVMVIVVVKCFFFSSTEEGINIVGLETFHSL